MKRLHTLVAILLLCAFVAPPVDAQRSKRSSKPKVSERKLRQNLSKIRREKAAIRSELRKTKRATKEVLTDIQRVDNRLVVVQRDLQDTTERLGESRSDQRRVAGELSEAQEMLAKTKTQVEQRIKRIYMRGKPSYISVLAGAKSVGEIATRQHIFKLVAQQDKKVFEQYKQLRDRVADRKREADRLVARVADLASRQRHYHSNLSEAKQEKKHYLGELREKQEDLEEALAQFEADERQIEGQIAAFYRRAGGSKLPAFKGRFSRPTGGGVTSGFGSRFHPILKRTRLHAGVDFGGGYGAAVWAAADGVVISAQYMRGYGNVVIIDHGGGTTTVYAHLSRFAVGSGARVKRGQRIGSIGATGLATGPHLHWEVRIHGRPVNPLGR